MVCHRRASAMGTLTPWQQQLRFQMPSLVSLVGRPRWTRTTMQTAWLGLQAARGSVGI
jgi:hypothetical protein